MKYKMFVNVSLFNSLTLALRAPAWHLHPGWGFLHLGVSLLLNIFLLLLLYAFQRKEVSVHGDEGIVETLDSAVQKVVLKPLNLTLPITAQKPEAILGPVLLPHIAGHPVVLVVAATTEANHKP